MPLDFQKCVDNNGKVRTKTLSGGRYMHLCKDKNGRWHQGDVKESKGKTASFLERK